MTARTWQANFGTKSRLDGGGSCAAARIEFEGTSKYGEIEENSDSQDRRHDVV